MPQVCDDEWHHYAINVDFPEVRIIIELCLSYKRYHFTLQLSAKKSYEYYFSEIQVDLIVDGEKWSSENKMGHETEGSKHHIQDNPEIIDDWPLHPAGDINTKVTIGACWQGNAPN